MKGQRGTVVLLLAGATLVLVAVGGGPWFDFPRAILAPDDVSADVLSVAALALGVLALALLAAVVVYELIDLGRASFQVPGDSRELGTIPNKRYRAIPTGLRQLARAFRDRSERASERLDAALAITFRSDAKQLAEPPGGLLLAQRGARR